MGGEYPLGFSTLPITDQKRADQPRQEMTGLTKREEIRDTA